MLSKILQQIENDRETLIQGLQTLITLPSSDGDATPAQHFVEDILKQMNFEVDTFQGIDPHCTPLPDYCPPNFDYDPEAYNVAGFLQGQGTGPSLLLFGHIDTEAKHYFGHFDDPYATYRQDGKIYGLGASDDKGGIAMMLYALLYVKKYLPQLNFDCTVLSILGKHGGAAGTLSALMKGYRGDYGIYLHPAETGHGFAEIKNISLGVIDLDIQVKGQAGLAHDDLDPGINANILIAQIALWLEQHNQHMRQKYRFDFGSFKDQPAYILNIGSIEGQNGYGGIAQEASLKIRVRFFKPLTIEEVIQDIQDTLANYCQEHPLLDISMISIKKSHFRATPALVETEDDFIHLIETEITRLTGISSFIHQYHGGSDIRLPILYGACQCIGIGPTCQLPQENSQQREWILEDDYIQGIKILASILYRFNDFKKNSL